MKNRGGILTEDVGRNITCWINLSRIDVLQTHPYVGMKLLVQAIRYLHNRTYSYAKTKECTSKFHPRKIVWIYIKFSFHNCILKLKHRKIIQHSVL